MTGPPAWPDLTPTRLTRLLRESGALPRGEVSGVEPGSRLRGGSDVRPLTLIYTPGTPPDAPRRLFCKVPSQLNPEHPNLREVEFYRRIAPLMQAGMRQPPLARCFFAGPDPDSGTVFLLLEDLSATHTGSPPTVLPPNEAQLDGILNALARLHAFWWDHPQLADAAGPLPEAQSVQAGAAGDARRYAEFTVFMADRLPPAARRIFETALAHLPAALSRRLTSWRGLTLIHDDPHLGNFLFPRDPQRDGARLIDWKSWSISPGPADLAHLMAVFWFPERRARLERATLARYHARLEQLGVAGYAWPDLWHDYRLCVAGLLHYPVWQWSAGLPDTIWWPHLNRLLSAFEDLHCAEVLG